MDKNTQLKEIRARNNDDAATDIGFLLGLLDRSFDEVRRLKALLADPEAETPEKAKDFAAEAAMKCADEKFQYFLLGHPKLSITATNSADETTSKADLASMRVRALCAVKSRSEFNDDAEAQKRWVWLRNDFAGWQRNGTYRDGVMR